jgi:hypothetical protein
MLERHERESASPEQRLHIRPWREHALGGDIRAAVQDLVEDLKPEMRLGDLVDLGEGKGESQPHSLEVLPDGASLVPEVPTRLLDQRKQPLVRLSVRPRHERRGV